jgi:dTDP-glucose 4,6-dehydratase
MKNKYLISGGCGFIASHFIHLLLEKYKDIEVINVDKLTYAGNEDNVKDIQNDHRYHFFKADIIDKFSMQAILLQWKPDYIVNFAAESHVDNSIKDADNFMKSNFMGVYNLLNLIKELSLSDKYNNLKKFVQIGTDEEYGSVKTPSKETDMLNPSSQYSASKASASLLALSYYKTFGLPVVVTRSSNNYGPNQFPEKIIPLFINNLLKNKKVPLYGTGTNKRDWIYVKDNCEAIDLVINAGKIGEIYNIASNYIISNIVLTKKILGLMKKGKEYIEYVTDRLGHDSKYAMNTKKITELGWRPKIKFKDGIKKTIEYYTKKNLI